MFTPSRNAKIALLRRYFATQPDPDRGFGLAAVTGELSFAAAKPGLIRELAAARTDPVLFDWSYDYVGDLAETVALMWPATPTTAAPPRLSEVVETLETAAEVATCREWWPAGSTASDASDPAGVAEADHRRPARRRLRRGWRRSRWRNIGGVAADDIEEVWHGLAPPYLPLFAWLEGTGAEPDPADAPVFRPPMLAHPLEAADLAALDPADWRAEWKWDGIRVQLVATAGGRRLYSRGADDISGAFPGDHRGDGVPRGARRRAAGDARRPTVAPFADLQQRLNRKTVTPKMMQQYPGRRPALRPAVRGRRGCARRCRSMSAARAWKPGTRAPQPAAHGPVAADPFASLRGTDGAARRRARRLDRGADAEARRQRLRAGPAEGPVVEVEARSADGRRGADVCAARPRQAQQLLLRLHVRRCGAGERAGAGRQGLFRLHRPGTGVPRPMDPQPHTARFGPVREVEKELVLEVAFDAVQLSTRHKSGVAHAFSAHRPHPHRQARRRGGSAGKPDGADRGPLAAIDRPSGRVMLACR